MRSPSFRNVTDQAARRTTSPLRATATPVRWFVDPLAYLAADRRTFPPNKNKKGPDYVAILRRQGFDAVNAASILGDGEPRAFDLALARFAAELGNQFEDLAEARCSDRMPLGFKASGWVDGNAAADGGCSRSR